jgi:hypothetical protein
MYLYVHFVLIVFVYTGLIVLLHYLLVLVLVCCHR